MNWLNAKAEEADDDAAPAPVTPPTPEPVKASPPPEPLPVGVDNNLVTLLRCLHVALCDPATDIELTIAQIGIMQIHEIIERLKKAVDEYNAGSAIKEMADRAEAEIETALKRV